MVLFEFQQCPGSGSGQILSWPAGSEFVIQTSQAIVDTMFGIYQLINFIYRYGNHYFFSPKIVNFWKRAPGKGSEPQPAI